MLRGHRGSLKKKAVLIEGILYLFVFPLLAFVLVINLLYKICQYFWRWPAYTRITVKAILGVIEKGREIDNDELEEIIEFAGYSYDPEQDIFYSDLNAWQRNFGYCRLYDEAAAPFGMIIDSEPIYFEYDGKKWLIELWKGQYDLTTGGEIGVYTEEEPPVNIPDIFDFTFYNSVTNTDLLKISYYLIKNDEILFTREDKHWWLTGFKLGEFSEPWELEMKISITLKNRIMCNAFLKGLNNAGYSDHEITRYGNIVSFRFGKPHTRQPMTRTKLTDWIIQRKNKYLCDKYQEITGPSNNTLEKLIVVQEKAPKMYRKILNIGKNKTLYRKYKVINNHLS